METNVHFGRLDGIRIGANWSFVFIFALMAWTLAGAILPEVEEGRPAVAYWVVAVIVAGLFFSSLVAHEMAHALVARRHGVEVDEITLWLLGGVSKLESDTLDARAELHVAIAGPLTSVALGLGWFALAVVAAAAGAPTILTGALLWLALVNVMLAVFNLLPAFPLDGGRVLRAALWSRGRSRVAATTRAAHIGELVAYGLVGLGFLEVLSGGGIGGLWLVLIGWFVVSAGRGEAESVRARAVLEGMRVRDVMTPDPEVAPAGLDIAGFVDRYLVAGLHSAYPVVDPSGGTVGLVTIDRLRAIPPEQRPFTTLGQVAVPRAELPEVAADAPATALLAPLVEGPARKVLVFEDQRLVGIVSTADVARAIHDGDVLASFAPAPGVPVASHP